MTCLRKQRIRQSYIRINLPGKFKEIKTCVYHIQFKTLFPAGFINHPVNIKTFTLRNKSLSFQITNAHLFPLSKRMFLIGHQIQISAGNTCAAIILVILLIRNQADGIQPSRFHFLPQICTAARYEHVRLFRIFLTLCIQFLFAHQLMDSRSLTASALTASVDQLINERHLHFIISGQRFTGKTVEQFPLCRRL